MAVKGQPLAKKGPSDYLIESLKKVDMVVETDTAIWLYTPATNEILEAGGRILLVQSKEETLWGLLPTEAHINRTYRLAEMFEKAEEIRVTSPAGTDFTCNKKGRPGSAQVGVVDRPGRWDNMGSGLASCAPLEDSANGIMVIDVGEPYFPPFPIRRASDRVKLTLSDGKIKKIEGKADGKILESWFAKVNDERSYIMSHISIGTHENANFDAGEIMEWESYLGGMLIAYGSNFFSAPDRFSGLGGANHVPSHIDMALKNCSCYLDGEKILDEGKLIYPDLK
jgi:2,5-dihydroxypyridine 5,6-dioxygenase